MTDSTVPEGHVTRISLLSSARRAGHAVWLERRLYEVVGAWAADAPEPSATVAFAVQAQRHADRAAEWYRRLPELRELPAAQLVVPPGEDVVGALDALAALPGTAARSAALVEAVLPALGAACGAVLGQLSPIADGPTMRSLRRMSAELDEEIAELRELWTSTGDLSGADDAAVATVHDLVRDALPLLGPAAPMAAD